MTKSKLRPITNQEARRAATMIDEALRQQKPIPNGFKESTKYDMEIDGKIYPPKAILGIALGLGPSDFSGGEATHRHLKYTDFPVFYKGSSQKASEQSPVRGVLFRPTRNPQQEGVFTRSRKQIENVDTHHLRIQRALTHQLAPIVGSDCIAQELSVSGGQVDLVTMVGNRLTLYEIKTASTAMQCIKEALGQLLSYLYTGGLDIHYTIESLVVVGPVSGDDISRDLLEKLSGQLGIPCRYEQIEA